VSTESGDWQVLVACAGGETVVEFVWPVLMSSADLVWSDPEEVDTWAVSPRGAGWLFGSKVTSEVTCPNNLTLSVSVSLSLSLCLLYRMTR